MPQDWKEVLPEWRENPAVCAMSAPVYITLENYGVLACSGRDAEKFLQGQLSCNMANVSDTQSQLGCYCDVKGRMLANFWITQKSDAYLLVMPRNMLPVMLQALQKYAVFSKVKLEDWSEAYAQYGIVGNHANLKNTLAYHFSEPLARQHILVSQENPALREKFSPLLTPDFWQLLNMRAGLVTIEPESSGLFTPHQAHFAQLGGVSLNKGCYLGQEIIARMHYLGKLKQHVYLCRVKNGESYKPGSDLINANRENLGSLINYVRIRADELEALAVLSDVHVGTANRIPLANQGTLHLIKYFSERKI